MPPLKHAHTHTHTHAYLALPLHIILMLTRVCCYCNGVLACIAEYKGATIDLDRAWWRLEDDVALEERGAAAVEVGEVEVLSGSSAEEAIEARSKIAAVMDVLGIAPCQGKDYIGKMTCYLQTFNPELHASLVQLGSLRATAAAPERKSERQTMP